jgi:lipoprotein-releasing system permease protein
MSLSFSLAARYLKFRKRQSLVAVLGVATGVAFFIMLSTILLGFQKYLISQIIDFYPHITISDEFRTPPPQGAALIYGEKAAIAIRSQKPKDDSQGLRNWPLIEAALARVPGAKYAGILTGSAILRLGSTTDSTGIVGIEPRLHRDVIKIEEDLIEGGLDALYTTQNGIIINKDTRDDLGAKLGDTVQAVSGRGVRMAVKIVGVTDSDRSSYMLLKRVQVLQQMPNRINQVRLRLVDVNAAPAIAKQMEAQFGYKAESWQEANQNLIRYSTITAILIVAAFGIFNVISTIIHEKARDIAILKSLGFRERVLQNIFIIQGIVLAIIGTLIGWALGYLMVEVLETIEIPVGRNPGRGLLLDKNFLHYVYSGSFALLAALLAGWWPSRKAARVNPVEIIRGVA